VRKSAQGSELGNASFVPFFLAIRTGPAGCISLALFREFDLLDEEV